MDIVCTFGYTHTLMPKKSHSTLVKWNGINLGTEMKIDSQELELELKSTDMSRTGIELNDRTGLSLPHSTKLLNFLLYCGRSYDSRAVVNSSVVT